MNINVTEASRSSGQIPLLTPIEKSILKQQREGRTAMEIASELKMTIRMVQFKLNELAPHMHSQSK